MPLGRLSQQCSQSFPLDALIHTEHAPLADPAVAWVSLRIHLNTSKSQGSAHRHQYLTLFQHLCQTLDVDSFESHISAGLVLLTGHNALLANRVRFVDHFHELLNKLSLRFPHEVDFDVFGAKAARRRLYFLD